MQQGPEEKTVLMDVPWPDEPPVLGPGQTFGSMTDTIADAVLTRPIGNVVVLMPPYCATPSQAQRMTEALYASIEEVFGKRAGGHRRR